VCKRSIQEELSLRVEPERPLVAFLSRMTHQKMADVVIDALPRMLDSGIQFAAVGEGDKALEQALAAVASQHPGQVAVRIGYDESTAHRLQAGADMLLHPSRFEPCGLVPIYAMRYGTIPIVRHVGGLRDIVSDALPEAISRDLATGFTFQEPTVAALAECLERAVGLYRQGLLWRKIQREAMRQDFGWHRSATRYLAVYQSLTGGVPEEPSLEPIAYRAGAGA
jgi:starch synthase